MAAMPSSYESDWPMAFLTLDQKQFLSRKTAQNLKTKTQTLNPKP